MPNSSKINKLKKSRSGLNLTVLSLNTNYWSVASNYALRNASSEASLLGEGMFGWAVAHLAAAAARGDKVMVLGHIPPHSSMWSAGFYRRWITALTPHYRAGLMLPHFFGHMHTDEWMVVRECTEPAGGGGGGQCTSLSGSISTVLTVLSWICADIYMCGALPSPVCA